MKPTPLPAEPIAKFLINETANGKGRYQWNNIRQPSIVRPASKDYPTAIVTRPVQVMFCAEKSAAFVEAAVKVVDYLDVTGESVGCEVEGQGFLNLTAAQQWIMENMEF